MKSDREFLDGIYQKAEARRQEIDSVRETGKDQTSAWRTENSKKVRTVTRFALLAACLLLVWTMGRQIEGIKRGNNVEREANKQTTEEENNLKVRVAEAPTEFRLLVEVTESREAASTYSIEESKENILVCYQVLEGVEGLAETGGTFELALTPEEFAFYYPEGAVTGTVQELVLYEAETGFLLSAVEERETVSGGGENGEAKTESEPRK